MFAHRFDNACQYGPNALSSMAQQSVDHVFADAVHKFFAGNRGGIKEGAAIFAAIEQALFVKTVKGSHQGRVGDALFKGEIDIADAHFAPPPRFIEYGALELAERERRYFVRAAKSTQ